MSLYVQMCSYMMTYCTLSFNSASGGTGDKVSGRLEKRLVTANDDLA